MLKTSVLCVKCKKKKKKKKFVLKKIKRYYFFKKQKKNCWKYVITCNIKKSSHVKKHAKYFV